MSTQTYGQSTDSAAVVSMQRLQQLPDFMTQLVDEGRVAGGVTIFACDGKILSFEAVGFADRENRLPMKKDTIFRIASMSKPITAVAVLKLVDDGKLKLDDPLHKYIPSFKSPVVISSSEPLTTRPAAQPITIRHLLTCTSGLGYPFSRHIGPLFRKHQITAGCLTSELTLAQMVDRLSAIPLLFSPGDGWEYGMSLDVLGRVVEVTSGKPFDEFCREEVFEPIGMEDTHFRVPEGKFHRLAAAYVPEKRGGIRRLKDKEEFDDGLDIISADYPYSERHKCLSGGGGLCSTASDFMKFSQMLVSGGRVEGKRFLSEKLVEAMVSNQIGHRRSPLLSSKYGFGVGVTPGDDETVHHNLRDTFIWAGSWSCHFRVSKTRQWILVTMSQKNWTDDTTPVWIRRFDSLAAESIN